MFGTPTYTFLNNDVVVKLPYRYEDRFKTENNNFINTSEQICTGGARAEPGARWLRVHWAIQDDLKLHRHEADFIRIHLFVKPSNVATWTDQAVKHFIFNHNNKGTGTREDSTIVTTVTTLQQVDILDIQADGIEWRMGFEFINNAFLQDSWKWSPIFVGCYFEYEQDGKMYYVREKQR